MQARGFLNYCLKYRWPKVIHCICLCQPNEREIGKNLGGWTGDQAKTWGAWPTQPPLRIATACSPYM